MNLTYYKNLDGLRGIAALMVVVFHFMYSDNVKYLGNIDSIKRYFEFGQHGVSLFFVLSGFVITRILIKKRNNKNYFNSFYWRRVLRILPLYYFYLLVSYFVWPLISGGSITTFNSQIPFYIYIQNLGIWKGPIAGPGHFWSLAV